MHSWFYDWTQQGLSTKKEFSRTQDTFAARLEFQACRSIESKSLETGVAVGVAPMESLVSHTYRRNMGDFRVRNGLNTSLVSPTFAYTICVCVVWSHEYATLFCSKQNLVTVPKITPHSSLEIRNRCHLHH